jgi:hypothetical protein
MTLAPSRSFLKLAALFLLLAMGPLSIYLLYNRTGGPESRQEMLLQRNLRFAFMGAGDEVDLAPLTAWPFVTVCALDSGLSEEQVAEVIGFSYRDYAQLHWLPRAEYWTLLFIDSERETNWGMHRPVTPIRIPREGLTELKLPPGAKGKCVPKTAAIPLTRRTTPVGISPVVMNFTD